ncbi:murein L,D-transpeptidase, partial [bacterium]|nr:murein L,D-transpeptidase [bacterium]
PTLQPLTKTEVKALPVNGAPLIAEAKGRSTQYTIPLNHLYDGDHTLSIVSVNGVGTPHKRVMKFKVNSTDKFGEAMLYLGAIGDDVEELQRRLAARGYLEDKYTPGLYDEATKNAVIALQKHIGVDQDGVCGPMVYGAIDKRIYVNLSQFEAKLVTEDEQVHTYSICTGVKEHPTPTGWFYIADMAKDPTWLPPNSEWAKDAKVIEPGPDNPLGTRWIGLDNGAIGFHGTPYPDSVGTRASHGCMRMRLADIEDLYDRVTVGTQVRIFAGDEDDATLRHYWH